MRLPGAERRCRDPPTSADVDGHVLADFGGVDVDVDLLRVRRVGLEVAGDAVVEPHAERDEQVGFLNGRVDPGFAVHAHHAEVLRVRCRQTADAEQRHRHGNARRVDERAELVHRAAEHDAVAGEDQRTVEPTPSARARAASRRGDPARRAGRGGVTAGGAAAPSRIRTTDCCASLVMSISTGPGRPDCAM